MFMLKIMRLTVASKRGQRCFVARLHESKSPETLRLDPVEFYQKWGGRIPQGTHFEIEIIEPTRAAFGDTILHLHNSAQGGTFICYPLQISDTEAVGTVFKNWCLGSALTLEEGIDLNTVYSGECRGDSELFQQVMRDKYGVEVISFVFSDK